MTDVDLFADEGPVCSEDAVGLFAGIGVGLALRELGITEHGIDNEPHVAATRERLGMATTCADITTLDPRDWAGADGVWASPPCTDWSRAGKGLGPERPANLTGLLPWVSMAEALEWPDGIVLDRRQTDAPTIDTWTAPCPTITSTAVGKGVWTLSNGTGFVDGLAPERAVHEPAPTLTGHIGKNVGYRDRWCWHRPATTVACDERLPNDAIKLATDQGCRLMGFPHPDEVAAALPATKRAAWQVIGNACCPPVVAAIVQALTTEVSP